MTNPVTSGPAVTAVTDAPAATTGTAGTAVTDDLAATTGTQVGFRPPAGPVAPVLPVAVDPDWTPGAAVERLAAERATGALRGPAGTVYLVDGLVTHAESDRAPDLAALLTTSGRLDPDTWREAVHRFGPYARVGEALVEQGRLTRGELELCHLGTLYDAACFLIDTPATLVSWTFAPGMRHWLGPVAAVGAHRLRREAERRRHLLDRIWPSEQLDTVPLRRTAGQAPAPGRHARRVRPPTRRQYELLDRADGRRTAAELARLLGRSAFATAADVRRLAAAGLLAGTGSGAVVGAGVGAVVGAGPAVGAVAGCAAGAGPGTGVGTVGTVPVPRGPRGLHRRVPGAALAALTGHAAPSPPAPTVPRAPTAPSVPAQAASGPRTTALPLTAADPDIALLIRVRTLLEARL
ncbi:hypothetical protein OG196_36705 [Kitasatospora purpeofusca]|uniref:hypothetical protein n=1 Tax=Kitasatospora purpeofusca TaxID=67352 RepID=UPI002E12868C|nr:hypothetical protein OG196_36705 [Kitasatospora purpeofusca]